MRTVRGDRVRITETDATRRSGQHHRQPANVEQCSRLHRRGASTHVCIPRTIGGQLGSVALWCGVVARRLLWLSSAARRFVIAALLVRWLDEWWSYLPAGIIEDLRDELGVTYAQAGWLIAIAFGGGLVGGPLGALADHVDRRRMAVTGGVLQTAGLATFALGRSFPVLALSMFVLGAASDLVIRPLESGLAETSGDDLDRMLGRQHLLAFVGDFVGPALLAIGAATALGWRGAFWITTAALAVFTITLASADFPPPQRPEAESTRALRGFTRMLRRPEVLWLALVEILHGWRARAVTPWHRHWRPDM